MLYIPEISLFSGLSDNNFQLSWFKKVHGQIIIWHKSCFKNKVTFVSDLKAGIMKKVGLIVVLALLAVLAFSSCNREACPAYSSADAASTEQEG